MPEYLAPGVYIEDSPSAPSFLGAGTSTGGMIGITQRGKVGVPIFTSSWDAFLREFAQGVESPFMANSDLAYAAYGFFQNGGRRLYVTRVASASATKAAIDPAVFATGDDLPEIVASDEGEWGNKLFVGIVDNEDVAGTFDIKVYVGEELVEIYTQVSNNAEAQNYWIDSVNNRSSFINCVSGVLVATLPDATATFTGGVDGIDDVVDDDFIGVLPSYDTIEDVTLMAIPGQTSVKVTTALMTYCENRKDLFAILDAPQSSDFNAVRSFRKYLSCKVACLCYPWIRVSDPLSRVGKLRDCPTAGHVMGVYSRIITERGVWKAPAGTEAGIRGALEVVTTLTTTEIDVLNPLGIISIYPKTNYGIVVWGARSISSDTSLLYVSDILLNIYIKKTVYLATQQFVFEANNQRTWTKVEATVEAFLNNLWRNGGLYGDTPEQAYRVRCNADLNPESVRNANKLIAEVSYAPNRPAEFVVFRFSHTLASSN